MYWIESKLYAIVLTCAIFVFASTCDNQKHTENNTTKKAEIQPELSFEEKIAREIENELNINAAEKYDLEIRHEYIDQDTLQDALILVNRKQWAHDKADKSDNKSFIEKTGFVGPNNYVFVKLGGKEELLKAPPVGSSADHQLESKFLTLTSLAHKDFYVSYRIRNSLHRSYYTVRKNRLYQTFSCPVFDSIGYENPRVFAVRHEESSVRISKDIALYKGKIAGYDPEKIQDPNSYVPQQIVPLDELILYFIFDEKTMKYKTPMVPPE